MTNPVPENFIWISFQTSPNLETQNSTNMLASQYVPKDSTVLTALAGYRATHQTPSTKPNAKRILKHLLASHPEWRLTHQRMVKILKREGKVPLVVGSDENSREEENMKELFSPKTRSKISEVDQPVRHQNIISSRLRPKSSLSFVYGKSLHQKTPNGKQTQKSDEDEDDAEFIPHVDEDEEECGETEGWSRTSKAPTPAPKAPIIIQTPSPAAAPTEKKSSGFLKRFKKSPTPTPPSVSLPVQEIVVDIMEEKSILKRCPSPDLPSTPIGDSKKSDEAVEAGIPVTPYSMNDDEGFDGKEDTQCFAGVKDMCVVM
ncbi:hypothetical protein TL16_g09794 [Triparma laevis f. inornata]|uniref:Uncharacterized protein n=1 Tax=Triparma laevis f. inornata TaxID=1714386 RepID=A0A9W7BDA3_9STRA|nr:hypothetical protein TL16_g09794 [Triparma laevis f. inornata]